MDTHAECLQNVHQDLTQEVRLHICTGLHGPSCLALGAVFTLDACDGVGLQPRVLVATKKRGGNPKRTIKYRTKDIHTRSNRTTAPS